VVVAVVDGFQICFQVEMVVQVVLVIGSVVDPDKVILDEANHHHQVSEMILRMMEQVSGISD
jgi:hypothetical protein